MIYGLFAYLLISNIFYVLAIIPNGNKSLIIISLFSFIFQNEIEKIKLWNLYKFNNLDIFKHDNYFKTTFLGTYIHFRLLRFPREKKINDNLVVLELHYDYVGF